jgi:hypothetical protein
MSTEPSEPNLLGAGLLTGNFFANPLQKHPKGHGTGKAYQKQEKQKIH